MFSVFIAYDKRTGQIVGVHHGPASRKYTWKPKPNPRSRLAVLRGPFPHCSADKRYTVDPKRKKLVEAADEEGASFGFGSSGGTSHPK